jgi:hypothetical protein
MMIEATANTTQSAAAQAKRPPNLSNMQIDGRKLDIYENL